MIQFESRQLVQATKDRQSQDSQTKSCPLCGESFTLEQLIEHSDIVPIGMRLDDADPSLNLYFFDHAIESCNTTFVIPIPWFHSLLKERVPLADMAGSCSCAQYCTNIEDFSVCNKECSWAPYRRLLMEMMRIKGIAIPRQNDRLIVEEW